MPSIPSELTLSGRTVVLTTPAPHHDEPMRRILSDTTTMQHLMYMAHAPEGWTTAQVEKRHADFRALQADQSALQFIILDKNSGIVLGCCGFNTINREHRNTNFGFIVDRSAWGRGAATESVLLCMDYAFSELNLHRIEYTTAEDNLRTRKFLENNGIALEGVRRDAVFDCGKFKNWYAYVLLSDAWPSVRQTMEKRLTAQLEQVE